MRVYIDGSVDPTTDPRAGNVDRAGKEFWIGHGDHAIEKAWSYPWDGALDEVRISDLARTPDWITAQHKAMMDTFATYGGEESSDFFNEAEGCYTIEMANDGKLAFDIHGMTYERYSPAFKIRNYRSFDDPQTVYRDGALLDKGADYNAAVIPFSEAWYFTWWDSSYAYRKKITVSAGSAGVPSGYSASVTFDHAALVNAVPSSKSLASGDDIRILHWDGSTWTELDRMLDPGSAWNNSSTKIWFKTQAAINANTSDENYYLYYGNLSPGSPPADGTNVFFFYDGYESGDFSAWDIVEAGTGDSNTVVTSPVHTGTYAAEAIVDPSASSYARVINDFAGQNGFHSTAWVYIPAGYNAEDDITVIAFYAGGGFTTKVATLAIRAPLADMRPLLGVWTESPTGWYFGSPALTTGAWHRLEMKVTVSPTNGRVEVWQDGVKSIDESNVDTGDQDIERVVHNIFWKSATTNSETLYFDDSFDKLWVDPEPSASLSPNWLQGASPQAAPSPWRVLTITAVSPSARGITSTWAPRASSRG
jgi:hypothetical protein